MSGRPFEVAWREEDTPEALKGAYQREQDPKVRTRLHSMWLLRCGWSLGTVAEVMGIHYRLVQRWVVWYREGGVTEVMGHKMGGPGRQPLLRPEEETQVSDAVTTGRFRTAWEIQEWITQEYGVSYTLGRGLQPVEAAEVSSCEANQSIHPMVRSWETLMKSTMMRLPGNQSGSGSDRQP